MTNDPNNRPGEIVGPVSPLEAQEHPGPMTPENADAWRRTPEQADEAARSVRPLNR